MAAAADVAGDHGGAAMTGPDRTATTPTSATPAIARLMMPNNSNKLQVSK